MDDYEYISSIHKMTLKEQVLDQQIRNARVVGDKFKIIRSSDVTQFHYQILMLEEQGYEAFGVPYAISSCNYCLHMRKKEELHAE